MATKKTKRPIEAYEHEGRERVNNPSAGLVTPDTDPDVGQQAAYQYDPHQEPSLHWAGKAERTSFEVPTVSLHIHERIDPRTIIEAVCRPEGVDDQRQGALFDQPAENPPLRQAVEFYQHAHGWSNRLVAGDSLLVMNSLLEKENMAGRVQMAYIDPPYGIKYGSNFQPFVDKRDVKDGKDEDLTAEPEQICAFRDTWEMGIHSYLSYLRDRLLLTRELLADSGSVFVQIGDENVHRVSMVLDDIFGMDNRVATISYATTSGSSTAHLPQVADYLLWYAKDKSALKYRQLYERLADRAAMVQYFSWHAMVELPDGSSRQLTPVEQKDPDGHLPKGARIFKRVNLQSQGASTTGRSEPYTWDGRVFECRDNRHWSIAKEGMDKLAAAGRLHALPEEGSSLLWKRYEDEVPGRRISNLWSVQSPVFSKRYVVQTATSVVDRCMLMATDPGDLVFDPTCGSGTTAYVAERRGRRWISCDTSRVALALAKTRLMTATFDYYQLAHPEEGVGGGMRYETVTKVSPSILSGLQEKVATSLVDRPVVDRKKRRVSGPFTVEAVPAPTVRSLDEVADQLPDGPDGDAGPPAEASPFAAASPRSGETLRQSEWREELLSTGIRGKAGQRIRFARLEVLPGCRYLHAEGDTRPDEVAGDSGQRAAIAFGPEHGPLDPRHVEEAIQEARKRVPAPELIVFAAFQFDPEAAKSIDEIQWPGMTLCKAQMSPDLQTGDLKKKRSSSESFWLLGQPEIVVETVADSRQDLRQVRVLGYDYFDVRSSEIISGGADNIAIWLLDTDYDGRSLYPRQVFFPMDGAQGGWKKLARDLKAEIDEQRIKAYRGTQSLPFALGEHRRIAVKIVDNRGVESLKALPVT